MSIAPLSRVALFGAASRRGSALAALQAAGLVHLDGFAEAQRRAARSGASEGERARQALRYLAATPRLRTQVRKDPGFDVSAFVDRVLANQERRRVLSDARETITKRLEIVTPWGDFNLPERPETLGGRLWFYEVPMRALGQLAALDAPWTLVHAAEGRAYVAVVSPEEPPPARIPGPRAHLGGKSLRALLAERETLDAQLDEAELEREGLTRRLGLLAQSLAAAQDLGALRVAQALAGEEAVFCLTGWVRTDAIAALQTVAEAAGVALAAGPPDPDDKPPTLLDPPAAMAAGADLTRLYQLPGPREWDPSAAVFASFSVFFALILSDAGYAAVLLAAVAALWGVMGRTSAGARIRGLALAASLAAVVWGVVAGSYFGAGPPHPLLAQAQLVSLDDFDAMMTLTVCVGAGHVALANAAAAFAARGRRAMWGPIGWIMIIAAGLAVWRLDPSARPYAAAAFGLGALLIIHAAGGLGPGLLALTRLTSLFADILSYLRLFALGLASASLAVAFNELAADAAAAAGGLGLLAGGVVLVAGHALNLVLSVVGGLVHGLRLNVIEFFNWGLAEEGRPFTPFARTSGKEGA